MIEKKLHIVHTESSGGWGGQEIRILNESLEFIKNGYQVTLICANHSPILTRAIEYNIPTVALPIGKKNIKGLWALKNWFSRNEFDLVNTHSSSDSWMSALGLLLAGKKDKALVRTRHVSAPVSNNKATCWLYHKASDHIVTTGERLKQTLIRDNGIQADKITSVPTGIDCSLFTPVDDKSALKKSLGLPNNKTIIGIVATLRSWKGHSYLLDAFSQLTNPDTHLLIVGNGPQWDNIHHRINELQLSDKVTLCGDQKDVAPWLQAMDIFALPSYANEGVPQSIMQAMACGLPVISTDVGSIAELVTDNTGIMVKPKDAASLKMAMENLLINKELAGKMALAGNRLANNKFTLNIMFEKMEEVFKQVISKKL